MRVTIERVRSWRMDRQFLRDGAEDVVEVVRRLAAVPGWSGDPELGVGRRLARPVPGALSRAHADDRVLLVFAFRGGTYFMTPALAAAHLALRASSRMWERATWTAAYGLAPEDWPALRGVVRDAVAAGPATGAAIADAITADARFRHVARQFESQNKTFIKPFVWQGDLVLGPVVDGVRTFRSPLGVDGWRGLTDLDEAGRTAVTAYLGAYGPASIERMRYWLGAGLGYGGARLARVLRDMGDALVEVEVEVDGEPRLLLAEHADELAAHTESGGVRLLPGFDHWAFGPGTADPTIVPPDHRPEVTRGASLVVVDGVVRGEWRIDGDTLDITWFDPRKRAPTAALEDEAAVLAGLLGRDQFAAVSAGST